MNFIAALPTSQRAYLSCALISVLPNLLLFAIPSSLLNRRRRDALNFQKIGLCFAVGGLMGDVFLHILPHLFVPHNHGGGGHDEHHHDHRDLEEVHDNHHEGCNHDHDHHPQHDHDQHQHEGSQEHHHDEHLEPGDIIPSTYHEGGHMHHQSEHDHHSHFDSKLMTLGLQVLLGFFIFFLLERITSIISKSRAKTTSAYSNSLWSRISSTGWLNLFADGLHNFTDGLAIGAIFTSASSSGAIATLLAVLFHEIPHEVGDMVILMECGLSKVEAIKAQFATAIFALLGTAIGIHYGGKNESISSALNAFTSGGFIYIACVTIVPKLLGNSSGHNHSHSHSNSSSNNSSSKNTKGEQKSNDSGECNDSDDDDYMSVATLWKQLALESVAFSLGIAIMILVLFLE